MSISVMLKQAELNSYEKSYLHHVVCRGPGTVHPVFLY